MDEVGSSCVITLPNLFPFKAVKGEQPQKIYGRYILCLSKTIRNFDVHGIEKV